jgi:predicted dienelactone hydrolase
MSLDRRKLLVGLPAALTSLTPWSRARAEEPPQPPHAGQGGPPPWEDRVLLDPGTRRRIRLRLRLPAAGETAAPAGTRRPLLVYSPGLGSGLSNGAAWCEAWRQAGFVVATLAHPGTDEGIWDTSHRSLRANLAAALASAQYAHRVSDCPYAIGQCLTAMGLEATIDPARIGIAGHSFGALTVQALAGAAGRGQNAFTIAAAIALSPGARSAATAGALAGIKIPFFCVTGDHDGTVTFGRGANAMRLGVPLSYRLAVYRHLPAGAKQLLVLAGADHMIFAGEPVSIAGYSREVDTSDAANARAWGRVSLATTAFWRYYLAQPPRPDRSAYLEQVRSRLDPADRLEAG